jgi:hypothetical protein
MNEREDALWQNVLNNVEEISSDFESVRLFVEDIPETTIELMDAVDINRAAYKLDDNSADLVHSFIGNLLELSEEHRRAIISELRLFNGDQGMQIELKIPTNEGGNE